MAYYTLNPLSRLVYCLDRGFPYPVIVALLDLINPYANPNNAWEVWTIDGFDLDPADFSEAAEAVAGRSVTSCNSCEEWTWSNYTHEAHNEGMLCESCLDDYSCCAGCSYYFHNHDLTWVDGDEPYCDRRCLDDYCYYCDECDEWSRDEHNHNHGCDCEAPHRRFTFPANGAGTVQNDERLDVTLPAGTIDEVGLALIRDLLMMNVEGTERVAARKALDAVGDQWQTKRGNFTRRLSRELYATAKIKLADGVLSEVGNLARQHSSDSSTWAIEFTRNLNMSAGDFCHEDSCWWQSYARSRCALKNWGGLGLRTFTSDYPDGRVWVQPLDADLNPTHDTMGAHAYLVYNAYGELTGYAAARIVAHLTSRTYRKVNIYSDEQYVNGDNGFLVADEQTCSATESLRFTDSCHHTYDASTINQEVMA